MPPNMAKPIYFGPFLVTSQVFHTTPHSFILTNLRPLLPGHTLVCPLRKCQRLSDLTPPEVTDLFLTVQRVQKTLKRLYQATAFNVAVQDGKDAGQTVPHVHVHVIPRQAKDMDSRGGGDKLYEMLEGDEGDIAKELVEREKQPTFKPDSERTDRSKEEMEAEAAWLADEMAKDDGIE
ncbi:hypothetical protein EG328_001689 [Venturia inaequalis]|uniref:Bis(5'-adenosyl)-triphosphatase n=1 Tax=Venturia inaequalis TaxID=5025 RepID=A0A8H3YY33_VENIN|nr:hypothetical protein EG328_001689 [Venturia inaequalis]